LKQREVYHPTFDCPQIRDLQVMLGLNAADILEWPADDLA
jgi:hypothetical protein